MNDYGHGGAVLAYFFAVIAFVISAACLAWFCLDYRDKKKAAVAPPVEPTDLGKGLLVFKSHCASHGARSVAQYLAVQLDLKVRACWAKEEQAFLLIK